MCFSFDELYCSLFFLKQKVLMILGRGNLFLDECKSGLSFEFILWTVFCPTDYFDLLELFSREMFLMELMDGEIGFFRIEYFGFFSDYIFLGRAWWIDISQL